MDKNSQDMTTQDAQEQLVESSNDSSNPDIKKVLEPEVLDI